MNTVHYYAALAYMDLKKDDEAIGELEASIQSPYVVPELYLTLGSLCTQRKRYREADDLCRKAIAPDPARSDSYLNLAQLYNAQGLSGKALDALRQARRSPRLTITSNCRPTYTSKPGAPMRPKATRAKPSRRTCVVSPWTPAAPPFTVNSPGCTRNWGTARMPSSRPPWRTSWMARRPPNDG